MLFCNDYTENLTIIVKKVVRVKMKISTLEEFRQWVKIQLVYREMSQNELARKMGIPQARISEATHGKPSGNKHILSIIEELDGDKEDFKEFLKVT